ncbi:farnesyl-diphosphate synthase [Mediterraneibacter butyricigenes]|uniref:Farnesyl diphosphate synthase n=1 Tax=Mediterraneibacter butyricigenes TaxID=2316025 RepID=A0A391P1D9_9FIRM|nr:farnesyl diphosphate synthase [Mediterraneibacter butyricigenes]RGV97314.1 polyprenyl synthetase family protein [Ruminococcus sp. AF14-10]GCA65736.1 farnesyl-diphosphate synthase [Mediterraneibacter butyricigenes]
MNFEEQRAEKVKEIEAILKEYLPSDLQNQNVIGEAMEYSLMAGGKRLRPMLMQEVYKMYGGEGSLVEPFMAALEMIHTYSLVHDDLPAMDNDDYRRGKKTTHVVYGEDMGILAGDALLNYAFETAATAFDTYPDDLEKVGKAIALLAKKAGVYGMIGGQVVDVKETGKEIDEDTLTFIYRLKTGALIEAAMMVGAVLAGEDDDEVLRMKDIASDIGMAFQIRDDILDVTSTRETLGKPILSDEKNQKMTYVTIHGLERAKEDVKVISDRAMEKLKETGKANEFLCWLVESLVYRES